MNTPSHVVVGAGAVGTSVAQQLAAEGEHVRVITRSGTGPSHPLIDLTAADATDSDALSRLADGAGALYNCASPAYHRWAEDWPLLAASLLTAACRTGAVLATASNVYGYGPVDGAMTESTPLSPTTVKGRVRADMWLEALAAHEAGGARVTEARGSEYLGPGAQSQIDGRALNRLRAGRSVQVPGDPNCRHTWTFTADMARLLITIASDPRAHGRAWHVPSHAPRSATEVVAGLCATAGLPAVPVRATPRWALALLSVAVPPVRGVREMRYLHDRPFTMDSTAAQTTFGLTPTPWEQVFASVLGPQRPDSPAADAGSR